MSAKMPDVARGAQVPTSHAAELALVRLEERRAELAAHSPAGLALGAAILAAMGKTANGSTPSIRCDQQVRYRLMQLDGSKGLPVEDLAAIAVENDLGRKVVLAGVRVLLGALGYTLTEVEATPVVAHEAVADIATHAGDVLAEASRALGDGRIDHVEAVRLDREAETLQSKLSIFRAAIKNEVAPRVDAHLKDRAC
jgi:hypothetical protein